MTTALGALVVKMLLQLFKRQSMIRCKLRRLKSTLKGTEARFLLETRTEKHKRNSLHVKTLYEWYTSSNHGYIDNPLNLVCRQGYIDVKSSSMNLRGFAKTKGFLFLFSKSYKPT